MSDSKKIASRIAYTNDIDFSKGFQRFHLKWPLKDLTRPKVSGKFETTVVVGDRNIILLWSLAVQDSSNDPTKMWFGGRLKTSGKITPMIYRICLSSSTNVLLDRGGFLVIDGGMAPFGQFVSKTEVDAYPINNLMLQCWIDIPVGIVIGNSDKKKESEGDFQGPNSPQKKSTDMFVLDASKMFSRVVGAGPPDPLSDFSVIIVNKEDEELRRFYCHAIFLSGRSDVFERMLALDEWKEKDGRSVKIKDISVQVMETVLRFIYTSTLPDPSIDHDHLCGLIFASDKYNFPELKNWCAGVLVYKYDSTKRRIEQLILADRHNLVQLKSVCIAQLSISFPSSFSDYAILKEISSDLWAEIIKAVSDRQMETTVIVLSAA